ncbi:MAG: beta-propeller fold lactonase family protein, partial [Chloroflexi bacterium]|nr:beta-propeller fold lactonase family protein [Chloroflexota bacterium]
GAGGSGRSGGNGGDGGAGGDGTVGGGGAGGTIKLSGTIVVATGATFDVSGGAGAGGSPNGGNGRVIIISNASYGTPAVTPTSVEIEKFPASRPRAANTYVFGSPSTPYIAGVPYILGVSSALPFSGELAGVTASNVPGINLASNPSALAAVVRLGTVKVGSYDDTYTGFDAVLFVNLTNGYLPTPRIGIDGDAQYLRNLPAALSPKAVWVTLFPESAGSVKINASIGASVEPISTDFNNTNVHYIQAVQPATLGPRQASGFDAVAVSPDGNQIYGVDAADGVLLVVNTNDLSLRQTFKDNMGGVDGLEGVSDVAISPDGLHLYIASPAESKVTLFNRDAFGNLSYVRTVSEPNVNSLAVSNNNVFTASSNGVAAFNQSLLSETIATGTPGGYSGFSNIAIGNDGTLFTVSESNDRLLMLSSSLALLDQANGLDGASAAAVSSDNSYVYVTGKAGNTLSMFQRSGNSLSLLQVLQNGVDGVSGLAAPGDVAVSPDGQYVFATGQDANAIVVFERYTDTATGEERLRFAQILRNNVGSVSGLQAPSSLAVASTQVFTSSLGQSSILGSLSSFDNLAALGTMPAPVSLLTSFDHMEALTVTTAGGADTILLRTAPEAEVLTTTINTGNSLDTVVLQDASATTTVNLGAGDDTASLQSDTVGTSVYVYGDAGQDAINVYFAGASTTTEIFGGADADTVMVMGARIPATASVIAHGNLLNPAIPASPPWNVGGDTLLFNPENPYRQGAPLYDPLDPDKRNYTYGDDHTYPEPPHPRGQWIQVDARGQVQYDTFEGIYIVDAPIVTFVGPNPIDEGDSVTLQVNVSPLGATNTLKGDVVWDLNGDNAFGDAVGSSVTLTWAQLQGFGINDDGVYQIGVSATNESDFTTQVFTSLTINNTLPVITITGNAQAYVNTPYQIDFSAFDPGDDHITTWVVDWDDGQIDTLGSTSALAMHTYLLPGSATIQLTATDEDGTAQATHSIDIWVDTAGVSAGGPYQIAEGQSLGLNGSAVGTPTAYSWDINGDGTFGDAVGASPTLTWAQLQGLALNPIQDNGTFNLQVRVSYTGIPAAVSNAVSLTVTNSAPSASLINNGPVNEGSTATVSFIGVSDPSNVDNSSLTFSYDFDDDGSFEQTDIASSSFTVPAAYLDDDGTCTVRGLIKDKDGGYSEVFTTITIQNVAPTLSIIGTGSSLEGSSYALSLSASDPGDDAIDQWIVDWADGSTDVFVGPSASPAHAYADNGLYTIKITAVDEDGVYQGTKTVSVANVAPALQNLSIADAMEGSFARLSGEIVDPGTLDSFTLDVDWGDGSAAETYNLGAGTATFLLDHRYIEDDLGDSGIGIYTVSISLIDDDGGNTTGSTTATVHNVVPSVAGMDVSTNPIGETGMILFSGGILDPGILDSHTLFVDWGDGTTSANVAVDKKSRAFFATHRYLDDNPTATPMDDYRIAVTVYDNDKSSSDADMVVTVENMDPAAIDLSLGSPQITGLGFVTLTGSIIDVSKADTHAVDIDWGDGTTSAALVDGATNEFFATHQYSDYRYVHGRRGGYLITVTVTDDDSGDGISTITVPVDYKTKKYRCNVLVIPVVSRQNTWIAYGGCTAVILRLPDGNQVNFGPSHGNFNFASLTTLFEADLPGSLPVDMSLLYGMDVKLFHDTQPVSKTTGPLVVSFVVPSILPRDNLVILFWDETLNGGQGDWVEMPTYFTEGGKRINTSVTALGTYVLAVRNQFSSLICAGDGDADNVMLHLSDGSFVQLPCGAGENASLLPIVAWNLPQALPELRSFLSGMRVNVYAGDTVLNTLVAGGLLTVNFLVPKAFKNKDLVVLRWDGTRWVELETVVTLGGDIWASAMNNNTGTFILSERLRPVP